MELDINSKIFPQNTSFSLNNKSFDLRQVKIGLLDNKTNIVTLLSNKDVKGVNLKEKKVIVLHSNIVMATMDDDGTTDKVLRAGKLVFKDTSGEVIHVTYDPYNVVKLSREDLESLIQLIANHFFEQLHQESGHQIKSKLYGGEVKSHIEHQKNTDNHAKEVIALFLKSIKESFLPGWSVESLHSVEEHKKEKEYQKFLKDDEKRIDRRHEDIRKGEIEQTRP